VNAAIEDGKSDQLGIVVMDELHMLDDEKPQLLTRIVDHKVIVFTIRESSLLE
jgi:thymidine kinase